MEDVQSGVVSRLFRAVPFSSLTVALKRQLEGLRDVNAMNAEGHTLLHEAVVHGRHDWVQALLRLDADATDANLLALAGEWATRKPWDAERRAILTTLQGEAAVKGGAGSPQRVLRDEAAPRQVLPLINTSCIENTFYSPSLSSAVTMESHQEIVARMFEAMSSGKPFQQQWEGDIRHLGNVDASYIEGRTLLQHAVILGMLDWVQALVVSGTDLSGDSGQTALELAREKATQHSEDWKRLAIKAVLEAFSLRDRKERQDVGVISVEGSPSVPHILNLQWLEDFLGVKLETCGERVKLPADMLQRLKETVDQDGNYLLMKAAKEGNFECVDLLLRCGAEVNASRAIDDDEQRAIDFAVERGHKLIVKLLLQWDSLIPHEEAEDPEDWLRSLAEDDQDIEDLLQRRDDFHKKVREGDEDGIREMVSSGEGMEDSCGHPRYWVNREGWSALLTAARYGKPSVLALLKRLNFECLENEEYNVDFEVNEDGNKNLEYKKAFVQDVVPIMDRHVRMMMFNSFMREGQVEPDGGFRQVYEAADKVREASVLMQCLQYEEDLEVIFDAEKTDISCIYPATSSGVQGIYDPSLHRVYASAALDPPSVKVSNLVHELAHAVMHVVFENDGLPYLKGDQTRKKDYENIVFNVLSPENIKKCNIIIQRVRDCYPDINLHPHELIVRVPEILTKLKVECDNGESSEPWKNDHEKELFNFYNEFVEKDIISWIEKNSIIQNPYAFYSRHVRENIMVGNIWKPCEMKHNGIHYLQVSNLALGVSHLHISMKGIVCVDWSKFSDEKKKKKLDINLTRGNISRIGVVWDEGMGQQFCTESQKCRKDCPAYKFSSKKEYVTFIVPKSFKIPEGEHPLEYEWEHLSKETKNWILGREVVFQGKDVTLKEMIDIVAEGSDVESIMRLITDSDDINWLIEGQKMIFGRKLKSLWGMRGENFARNHPEICIERTMEMREIDLKGEIARGRDAFFLINAKESEIEKMDLGAVSYWNSENVPDGANCFLLEEHPESQSEKELCDGICEQIHHSGKEWPHAHFFRFSQEKYIYVLSHCMSGNRCRLLADEPGCGKTVYVYDAAMKEKENHPERWTEVVELSKCEEVLKQWNENNSDGNGSVEEFLYDLLTVDLTESQPRNMEMARELFKRFCQAKEKVSIYFDGFDEVCPKYEKKCSSFLRNLREKSKVNFLVTTRTNEVKHLEENFCKFTIHLVPFDRREQVRYLNEAWISLLKSVEESKRADKLTSILSNLRAHSDSGEIFGKLIENLKSHSEDPSVKVDFSEVAEEVIWMFKSSVEGEGYLSEVPLHAWMIATVLFEDNFRIIQSLELSHLYTQFVTAKLNEYCSEKAKLAGRQSEDVVWRSTFDYLILNLKTFSAFFFLRDQTYKPKEEYLSDLVRAGLLLKKSGSFDFSHRTLGEFFFSIWILEKVEVPDVTRKLLESVLLDNNFKKVRAFINDLLLLSDKNTTVNGGDCICEISEPSKLAFDDDEEFSILFYKCFHRAVYSRHRGIIKYLAKSWKERIADALFSRRVCDCWEATEENDDGNEKHNSFCIKKSYKIESRYVETIHTLLTLTEENGLVENLRDFISECGLEWTGFNVNYMWGNEKRRAWLLRIIHFFSKHIDILRKSLEDVILRKDHLDFLEYFSFYSFNKWKSFLNTILGENWFRKLLVLSSGDDSSPIYSPMTDVWNYTVEEGSVEKVSEMWEWIKSNLETNEERKEFLRRKNEVGDNCLSSSIFYNDNYQVVKFVWEQVQSQFRREELKEFIFESFESNKVITIFQRAKHMTDWLRHVTAENVISLNDTVVLLRKIPVYAFTIGGWFPVQDFLMAAGGDEQAREEVEKFLVEGEIWGLYADSSYADYREYREFRSFVQREWERILPLLSPHLPTRPISLDEKGRIMNKSPELCVHLTEMVTYLLFSWRQFKLIFNYLASSDLRKSALKNYFSGIFASITKYFGSESIPFVFSVPTAFFSKEQMYEAFLASNFLQKIADLETWHYDYALQFLVAYDFARLCLGEDALWVVHSFSRGGRNESLLNFLLKKQEEGIFERYFSVMDDFLRKYPPSHFVDLRSLEFCEEEPYFRMSNESDNGST